MYYVLQISTKRKAGLTAGNRYYMFSETYVFT